MRARHGAAGRAAIPVIAATCALTLVGIFAKGAEPQAKTAGKSSQVASAVSSPCANKTLSNRDFLVDCLSDAIAVMNQNTYLRTEYTAELAELRIWTKALSDGRMSEKAYLEATFARVDVLLKAARDNNFTGAPDMEWALSDLKTVLGHRKAGSMAVMDGPQMAIAN